jgi:hypothetical protein
VIERKGLANFWDGVEPSVYTVFKGDVESVHLELCLLNEDSPPILWRRDEFLEDGVHFSVSKCAMLLW